MQPNSQNFLEKHARLCSVYTQSFTAYARSLKNVIHAYYPNAVNNVGLGYEIPDLIHDHSAEVSSINSLCTPSLSTHTLSRVLDLSRGVLEGKPSPFAFQSVILFLPEKSILGTPTDH